MRRSTIGILAAVVLAAVGVLAVIAGVASGASKDSNGSNFQSNSYQQNYTHTCTDPNSADGGGMRPPDDSDNDGDTISFTGFKALWPPNHKYRYVTITATAGSDLDPTDYVRLDTNTTSNEVDFAPGMGAGHTFNDVNPIMGHGEGNNSASVVIGLRGERNGRDPTHEFKGRTYTIRATATYDGAQGAPDLMSDQCHAQFTVRVPHDMGHG